MTALALKALGLFASGSSFFHWKSSFQLLCVKLCEQESRMKRKEYRGFRLTSLFRHGPMIKHQLVWQEERYIIYKSNALSK